MATTDGVLSDGTQLWVTNGSGTLTRVLGLLSCNRPNLVIGKVESTDHESGKVKEYIAGHGDISELQATLKYEPGSATDTLLLEVASSRVYRPFKLVVVEEDGTTQDVTASLLALSYVPDNAPLGGMRTATFTGQPKALTQAATV